jgi:predicted protein tyrosine phosphatase
MNRAWVSKNPYQGKHKRVLCCCSAGVLRSPTAAEVLSQKFGHNTRACGVDTGHALIPIDTILVDWADEIVVMTNYHKQVIEDRFDPYAPIICLDIPDEFAFRDPRLIELIEERYTEATKVATETKTEVEAITEPDE